MFLSICSYLILFKYSVNVRHCPDPYSVRELLKLFQAHILFQFPFLKMNNRDFPGGAVINNLPANAGDTGSSPGPGRSHMPWSN